MSMTVLAPIPIWFVCKLCRGLFHEIDKFVKHEKEVHSVDFASVKCIIFEVTAAVINHNQDLHPELSKILNEQEEGSLSRSRSYLERLDKLTQDIFSQRIQYEDEILSGPGPGQGQHHTASTAVIASGEEIQDNSASFVSPEKETKIHKIITPPSPPTTITNVDSNPSIENIQTNQSSKIEIDSESSIVFSDHCYVSDDANNCFELNFFDFNSNDDNDEAEEAKKNDLLENISIARLSTDSNVAEEQAEKHFQTTFKSTVPERKTSSSFKRSKRESQNIIASNDTTILQSVIQSPNNPYVYLEKLNLSTLQKTDPSTYKVVNLNYGPLLEVVKNEYVADGNGNEDSEFPDDEDLDPLESESPMKSLAQEDTLKLNVTDSSSTELNEPTPIQAPQTGLYSFYCVPCNKKFSHMQQIKEHNKRNHETQDSSKKIECPHPNCEITTSSKLDLTRHLMLAHSSTKPFKCRHPNCTLSFKTEMRRTSHSKLHATKEVQGKFKCPYSYCGQSTNNEYNLKRHLTCIHSDDRPFPCPHPNCDKSFKLGSSRDDHWRRVHSPVRPFKCPLPNCTKSFTDSGDLKRHRHRKSQFLNPSMP